LIPTELNDLLLVLSIRGLSRATIRRTVRETWRAGGSTREAIVRLQRDRDLLLPSKRTVRDELASIERLALRLVDERDAAFPPLLREIPDAPVALFVQGRSETLLAPMAVAIVGSRRGTAAGQAFATALARDLAQAKVTVVSGLAKGIDGASHRGALDGAGVTIAVMGGGHDEVYPPTHRNLAARIVDTGALISEYPPSTPTYAAQFPERNRIISGLCAAVVVVEATDKSGSLITARMALEQGREVMAVPGAIEGGAHRGCHRLIRQGALLVEGVADVLEGLGLSAPLHAPSRAPPSGRLARVLDAMTASTTTAHDIVESLGMSVEDALTALVELELEGFVTLHRGGYIRRPLTTRDT
jgi:DNA processing protein